MGWTAGHAHAHAHAHACDMCIHVHVHVSYVLAAKSGHREQFEGREAQKLLGLLSP